MKILFTFLFSVLSISSVVAQRYYPSGIQSRHRVGIGLGSAAYFGDLQEGNTLPSTLNLSFSYEYQLRGRLALRADAAAYQLAASDANAGALYPGRQERNLSFHATNAELSGSFVLYLFRNLPAAYRGRSLFNLYGLMGMGLTYYNPKTTLNDGNTYRLRDFETEGVSYSKISPLIPMGMGIQAKINRQLDMALEVVYRSTFTDYLDDVSTVYPDPESHKTELAATLSDRRLELGLEPVKAGTQRGNPEMKDGYAFYNIRFLYYLTDPYYKAADKKKKLIR
jgi:hypothetical protein